MICPYRKLNDKETKREYKPFPEGSKIRTTELEYFPQCQGDECPFYVPDKKTGKHICGRVRKELATLVRLDKEEEILSTWAN